MKRASSIHGLYAITSPALGSESSLQDQVTAAIRGGAKIIQYRDKQADSIQRRERATMLREVCSSSGAMLIINDDADLACEIDADGVHIGTTDGKFADVRARIGAARWLGISCYDSLPPALAAQDAGADYVAFGSVYPSPTKPRAARASLELLTEARRQLRVPIVAIGGITLDNAAHVIAAGVDAVAVISGLFETPDIETTARDFSKLFDSVEQTRGASRHP